MEVENPSSSTSFGFKLKCSDNFSKNNSTANTSTSTNGDDVNSPVSNSTSDRHSVFVESVLDDLQEDDDSISSDKQAAQRTKRSFALFRHQVAGHLPLFWSHGTVCKPAFPTEIQFYLDVHKNLPDIIPFIPKFLDVVQLVNLTSVADSVVESWSREEESKDFVEETSAVPARSSSEASNASSTPKHHCSSNGGYEASKWGVLGINKNLKTKIGKLDNRYLVLQDLTYGYKRPCILDLKLGTRQHGLNAPPEKIKSKTAKVNSTTSKSMGLRVCGMQVYMPWSNEFVFRDKYYGRSLDDAKFKETLKSYFFNGVRLRSDAVQIMIERLKALLKVFQSPCSYVFYACSILLIYEGFIPENEFASGTTKLADDHTDKNESSIVSSSDENLSRIHPQQQQQSSSSSSQQSQSAIATSSSPETAGDIDGYGGCLTPTISTSSPQEKSLDQEQQQHHPSADMRLIDFAHTYPLDEGTSDTDSGVPFGLQNLISILQCLLDENNSVKA